MKDVNFLIENGVDINKSLELFGDIDTYNLSLNDFLEEIDTKLINIKKYKEIGDMPNYAILVHSLKSDARYFGFNTTGELAYKHELESKANNIGFINSNYDELMNSANKMVEIVKRYVKGEKASSNNANVVSNNTNEIDSKYIINDKAIIVADDSTMVRNFIQKIFGEQYNIVLATDGNGVLNYIKNNDSSKIMGILLDLMMPVSDGFVVLDYLSENDLFNKIPVSIISGNDTKELTERAFKYPIVDMLSKPFSEQQARSIVDKTINYFNINV